MTEPRRRQRTRPRPPLPAVLTGVGLATSMILAAVELLHVFDPADPGSGSLRLFGILVVLFLVQALAAAMQGLVLVVVMLGRLLTRFGSRRGLLAGLPAALLVFLFVAPRVVDLFSGPWVAQQSWRPAALVAILIGGGFLLVRVSSRLARGYLETGRLSTRLVVVAAVAAPLFFLVDAHESLARKQIALHDLLAFGALVAAALAGSRFSLLRWRRCGAIQLGLGLLAALLVASDVLPGDSPYLREVLLRRSRMVGRVLRELLPQGDESAVAIDLKFLAELDRARPIPQARLDAALPGREAMDVVLITIDTLRHDGLGITGGSTEDTPVMDAFIGESRFLPRAWTQFPSSRLALNAMFTGRYPTAGKLWENAPGDAVVPLDATEPTLAELLGRAGFRSEAVTAFPADFLRRESAHITRGFDRFRNDEGDGLGSSERVIARALETLRESRDEGERLFLWVHLFDPHKPYRARGANTATSSARARYRGEVSHADACLDALLGALDLERSIVVLHSDHGEEFEEHGGIGHHSSLYEEQIRVPVAFRLPGIAPGVIDRPVGLIDLRPTLLDLVGADDEPGEQGRSLAVPLLGLDDLEAPPRVAFAQFREPRFVQGDLDALVHDELKIVHDRSAGLFEVYDLAVDPGETRNLALTDPDLLHRMRSQLAAMRRHLGLTEAADADRDGSLLVQRVVGDPSPGPELLARLISRLRDPEALSTSALDALLDHPSGRLRRMAVMRIATHPRTPAYLSLQDWASSEDRGRQLEAALGLSLLGNDGFREDLSFLDPDFLGDARLLGILARYAGGEEDLAEAVHQLLADPNNDRDTETLGFAVIGRMGDPRGLIAYYTRLMLGLDHPEQRLMLLEGTIGFPFAKAAPVLRVLLRHPDRALRARVDDWFASRPEHADWLAAARRAERLAQRARDLGVRPEVLEEALDLYGQAQAEMTALGRLDWGLVMETAFLLDVCGERAMLAEVFEPWIAKLPLADDFARGLALRFIGLARATERPFKLRLEALPGQAPRPGEGGRALLLVRISVDPESAGLVGGLGPETEYLAAAPLDRLDQPIGEPEVLPLPLTALLPGEEAILAVPVRLEAGLGRAARVGLRLGRGDRELAPPLVIEALR